MPARGQWLCNLPQSTVPASCGGSASAQKDAELGGWHQPVGSPAAARALRRPFTLRSKVNQQLIFMCILFLTDLLIHRCD